MAKKKTGRSKHGSTMKQARSRSEKLRRLSDLYRKVADVSEKGLTLDELRELKKLEAWRCAYNERLKLPL